ncbi:MAG TPA: hypothetical protein VFF06_03305 [Polyangia bacterium]|nr:hypothetical protein [Polyangia bacterium]
MSGVTVEKFTGPASLLQGLKRLRERGITPRGLLFLALSPDGAIHIAVPEDPEQVTSIKIGEKLALVWPLEGRYFHFDNIHRLPGDFVLYNGDRRLKDPGDAPEVAQLVASFVKGSSAKNVLFGCTAHQPGSWLVENKTVVALHEHGVCEVVPVAQGLFARRVMDHRLFFLPFARLASTGRVDGWGPVFDSPLGNVLLLERRVLADRLVLSCEHGLVEVDVSQVPRVVETARATTNGSMAVVGRIDGGSFAVTSGTPQPWGLDEMRPALLVGGAGAQLADLGRALATRKE